MVYDIVKKRPADPAAHALQWLTNFVSKYFFKFQTRKNANRTNLTVKTMSKKFLSITQSLKRRNCKAKQEAEWEFQSKFLAALTRNKAFNWNQYQNLNKPSSWFKVSSATQSCSKTSITKMRRLWLTLCNRKRQLKIKLSFKKVKMEMPCSSWNQVNTTVTKLSMGKTNTWKLTSMAMLSENSPWCITLQEQQPLRWRPQELYTHWTESLSVKSSRTLQPRKDNFTGRLLIQLIFSLMSAHKKSTFLFNFR